MSILSLILPVITVISLFLYIFSAERAYLPRKGTIEWIERASSKKTMIADTKFDFKLKDQIICLGIIIVYGAVYSMYTQDFRYFEISSFEAFLCNSAFIGLVYIFANYLFKNRVSAVFSSVMAASTLVVFFFRYDILANLLFVLFVFAIISAAEEITLFIIAGLCLAYVVYDIPVAFLFTLLALCPAIISARKCKSLRAILLWAIFCFALPTAALILRYPFEISVYSRAFTTQPVYNAVTAVCLIVTAIHIFKDKSYPALFITVGLVISIVCKAAGYDFTNIFSCLAIAYPASIIIKRGKKAHRVFCIIFGSVMLLMFLLAVAHKVLKDYAPQFAFDVKDVFNYVFPFVTYY